MSQRAFQTPAELAAWLAESGIDMAGWGAGPLKGLADLWAEYTSGETTFQDQPPTRLIEVAKTIIRHGDAVLIEIEQEFADGRRRARLVPPSEKLKAGETPRNAALRCLCEELGLGEANLKVNEEPEVTEGVADSPSYPGLRTRYRFFTFEASTDALPNEDFYRDNAAPGDPIRRHRWGWRKEI
ncbi:MAG: NUDIX domain-containing protein [Anaerolineae bacterium]|uniref:NUDIX domain-containing protein n=1 Tax=Promineifilum sp. TaxID=2664178 RepID=UPI001D9326A8|nr:NUDIX domain-containing protein [Anaerolineales bacterium]MCB8935257.1 NUDIX domain-containing protein [Promineifilum sp.]MCO5178959.1 NUDIX domain-containing protein [Promineifilum sp.]MCW5847920.1 NUDIX domain-containing protein [Anaerolineae bacterium]